MSPTSLDSIDVAGLPRGSFVHRIERIDDTRREATVDFSHFDHIRQAVCITDTALDQPGPVIEYVNQSYLELFCCERADVLGVSPRFGQGPLTNRAVLDRLRAHLERRQSIRAQAINYRVDGSPFYLRWTIDSIDLVDGSRKFVAMLDDVTTEHRLRQRLVALDVLTSASRATSKLGSADRRRAVAAVLETASAALLVDLGRAIVTIGEATASGERPDGLGEYVREDSIPVEDFGVIELEVHPDGLPLVDRVAFDRIVEHAAWELGLPGR